MEGIEIQLPDMLECRERRAYIQEEMIRKHHLPLVSFCMNIPGPIKTNARIRNAFDMGMEALLEGLPVKPVEAVELHELTGDELIAAVDMPAEDIKQITLSIEESHIFGRLYDMDVIGTDGNKLSRKAFRKCLICDRQAQECARTRKHTVAEMQAAIDALLENTG